MKTETHICYSPAADVLPISWEVHEGAPLEERMSSALMVVALCKEDKEQLNRIEGLLRDIAFSSR